MNISNNNITPKALIIKINRKENIPFFTRVPTFIRAKEKLLLMACLIFLLSEDLLSGNLFYSYFAMQMPME